MSGELRIEASGVDPATLEAEIRRQWDTLRDAEGNSTFRQDAEEAGVDIAAIDEIGACPFEVHQEEVHGDGFDAETAKIVIEIGTDIGKEVGKEVALAALYAAWEIVILPALRKGKRLFLTTEPPDAGNKKTIVDSGEQDTQGSV